MLTMLGLKPKQKYKCFDDEVGGRKLKSSSYKGTRPIDVNKIVGSVNRCQRDNSISVDKKSQRYQGIKESMQNLSHMPPIKVYDLDDEYYIVDGHHRVEASKEIGKDFLDAEIIEYKYH